jgi:MFS superfamily sulfate permease-like transporter
MATTCEIAIDVRNLQFNQKALFLYFYTFFYVFLFVCSEFVEKSTTSTMSSADEHTRLLGQPTRRFGDYMDDDFDNVPTHDASVAITIGGDSAVYEGDINSNSNNNRGSNANDDNDNSLRRNSDESIALRRRMSSWWLVNDSKSTNKSPENTIHNNNNNDINNDINNNNNDDDDDNDNSRRFDAPSRGGDDKWGALRGAWRKLPYYIPVTMWLPAYKWRTMLLRDLIAGVAVASLLIPQSLAYALLAGMPPIYGLYTAFFPTFIYAMMGQSRHLSMGPDALVSILFGLAVPLAPDNPIALAQIVTLFVGIFLFVLGLLRLGFLDVILSRPLLAGFINAVVVEIIMEQLTNLFGIPTPTDLHGWHKMFFAFSHMDLANALTAIVGFTNIAVLLSSRVIKTFAKKRWPNVVLFPDLLIVVALNIGFSYGFDLQAHGLKTLGNVGTGFAAAVAAADRLARRRRRRAGAHHSRHRHDRLRREHCRRQSFGEQERLLGVGEPRARRLRPQQCVLVVLWRLADVRLAHAHLDRRARGRRVARLLDCGRVRRARHDLFPRPRVQLHAARVRLGDHCRRGAQPGRGARRRVSVAPALVDESVAVSVYVCRHRARGRRARRDVELCHLALPRAQARQRAARRRARPPQGPDGTMHFKCLSDYPSARPVPGVAIVRLGDPLFFGNSSALKTLLNRIEHYGALHAHPSTRAGERQSLLGIVLHCAHVPSIDPTALFTLREIADDCRARGIKFVFVKLRDELKRRFLLAGIITPAAGELSIFPDTNSAVEAVLGNAGDSVLESPAT